MTVPTIRRSRDYLPDEDVVIVRMSNEGKEYPAIADALGREAGSVRARIWKLRQMGRLSPARKRRDDPERSIDALHNSRPLWLDNDDRLVAATVAQGGFPRAVRTRIGTIWAGLDNRPWRYAA